MDIAETIIRIKSKVTSKGLALNSPLSQASIAKFEHETRVSLPDGYREFLLHVGDGGDGPPDYGMLPMGLNPMWNEPATVSIANMQRAFPFTEYWVWEYDDERDEDRYAQTFDGNLNLGTDGCAMHWLLIINGSERGQIWNWSDVGIQPCSPKREFLDWYEYWLDGGNDWYADLDGDS